QGGAAQAAAGREERDRLQAIGLAGTVGPDQRDHVRLHIHARRAIAAEMRQRQAVDAGWGHWVRGRSVRHCERSEAIQDCFETKGLPAWIASSLRSSQ